MRTSSTNADAERTMKTSRKRSCERLPSMERTYPSELEKMNPDADMRRKAVHS
jgi:hypothetical protein